MENVKKPQKNFRSDTTLTALEIKEIIEHYPLIAQYLNPTKELEIALNSMPKLKEAIEKWEAVK